MLTPASRSRPACRHLLPTVLVFLAATARAADPPGVYALTNARIVSAPGRVIPRGTLVVRRGLVEAVGASVAVPADAQVIDLAGRTIYPGLIDPYVTVSRLSGKRERRPDDEPQAGTAARGLRTVSPSQTPAPAGDVHPVHAVRPETSAGAEVRLDPETVETLRSLGFTAVAAVPDSGVFRGTGAVLSLGDGPVSKQVAVPRWGQHISLEPDRAEGSGFGEYPASKMGAVALVRQTLLDARWLKEAEAAYAARPLGTPRPERVGAWAALADAAAGKEPVVFETPDVLALLRAGAIASEMGLVARFVGAPDAYRLLPEVLALKPELVLTLDFPPIPTVEDDDEWLDVPIEKLRAWDRAPSNPRWLRDGGLSFALTTHRLPELTDLPERVRRARARGLSEDDVLAAFTKVPARLLGLPDRLGEIAPGRPADLAVVAGSLFSERGRVVETWVDGIRHEVKPRKPTFPAAYRFEGFRLDLRTDPRAGGLSVLATPEGGRPVAAGAVSRHEGEVRFEIDGEAVGVGAGAVSARALLELPAVRLELRRGQERFTRHGEKETEPEARGEPRGEIAIAAAHPEAPRADLPDSDVRPLPERFATPLAAPRAVLVRNATVWTSGPQGVLLGANILVVDGKVQAVGKDVSVPPTMAASVEEIDGTGLHVTPGLIDCHSHTAIDGPVNEGTHNVTAEVRIGDVLNPFSPALYRELAGGLTAAHTLHGSANAIGGQDEVIRLKWGEGPAGLKAGAFPGIKFALGENPRQANSPQPRGRYPQTRMGVSALIRERFLAARDYRRRQREALEARKRGESPLPVRTDLALEAIAEVLEGKRLIHSHAYVKQEMLDLIRLCEEFGVTIGTLQHVLEGYKIADEIAAHTAGASAFSDWWAYKLEVYDAIPYNGPLMRERGVLVSFNSDSDELARRLNLEAAKAVKYGGIPPEEALKLVTLNPARQLRLESRIGSLEAGKDGDFVLWSSDPLSSSAVCRQTWIEGKKYFDRDADLQRRPFLEAEKADLVSKARVAAARSAPGRLAPGAERARPGRHGCLDEVEDAEEATR